MTKKIDVLVNGGGIGGATVAYYLALAGLQVVIVEHRDKSAVVSGADLLKPSGIRVMKKLGLLDEIIQRGGQQRSELKVFHNGEPLAFLDYKKLDGLGYFILSPYEMLRALLWEKLSALDNVKIHFSTKISSLSSDEETIKTVTLNNNEVYSPTVVVGADGSGSYIRKWMNIDATRGLYKQKMYLACFPIVPSAQELNRLYVDEKQGLAYFYPISESEFRLVIGFPENEAKNLLQDKSAQALKTRLMEFVTESDDALVKIDSTEHFKGIPITHMHVSEYHQGNAVLLGNAIHNVHPITGQGMNLAIEDAGELGTQLVSFFRKEQSLDTSLANYFENRSTVNASIVAYGHSLATTFHSKQSFADSFNLNLQGSGRKSSLFKEINIGAFS